MFEKLKSLFKRVEVPEVKKAKATVKGIAAGFLTYLSLLIAKRVAPELELPVEETAGAVALLIGGLINLLKHKTKKTTP